MTTSKNRLTLDYKDLPDLKAALGGAEPGDRVKVEFELMVVSNDDDCMEGDIEAVEYETPDDEDAEDGGSGEVETSTEEPVMAIVARVKKPSKSAKAAPDSPEEEAEEEAAAEDAKSQ